MRELPKPTRLDLQATVRQYWLERVSRHKRDSYVDVRMAKFPEDLRVYEHLIWASKPNAVIEIGTLRGGSALWFRDRLRASEASILDLILLASSASGFPASTASVSVVSVVSSSPLDPPQPSRGDHEHQRQRGRRQPV